MATLNETLDNIEKELTKVTKTHPFKKTDFGGFGSSPVFPSLNFSASEAEPFDQVDKRPSGMQLKWEIKYDVQVICAAIINNNTRKSTFKTVNDAIEIFLDQMATDELLNGLAFDIAVSGIRYDLEIGEITGTTTNYAYGGVFTLTIQFIQEKNT
jgi:hypothetical protein